ncbi:lethal(3)malignant brain tumor-like protein 4 isoform X1 [Triplophysa rosa]|uniref:Lethal3malignant brain tumor-like protein 4 n=1 Tax=Triplophysa rosa TaxID=992332 RepID=A0A9W7WQV1_TRIRA|nr:lethal(3)malignant brain tumor-like protein 4 isoform X1 [Triplophysa rosa]XP_057196958.1 lethal(3)malignant brain tumor-like protein 4 isoform X1 [Triplophysa rosa]KAI7806850.1 putative lethal3malignant brain tumor-like protein 4 [Triplophysa rosa]
MADTSSSDGPATGADFDMMGALDWQDGIATLPGSDIRFRMTEFGTLEIVTEAEPKEKEEGLTDSHPQTTTPNNSHCPEQNKPSSQTAVPQSTTDHQTNIAVSADSNRQTAGNGTRSPSSEANPSISIVPNAVVAPVTEVANCRSCGHSGPRESFLQGKYCSAPCVQPSSGRSTPAEAVEGERLGKRVRRKKKMFMDSGDEEEDNIEEEEEKVKSSKGRRAAKVARLATAPLVKKKTWSWAVYLEEERAIAAPLKLFKEHQSFPQSRNGFKVGMKLEGLDPCHPALFCVLTVAEVQGYRIRLHFDGYPECYDYWVNADSWDVKPPGWCEKMGLKLLLPKGCRDGEFNWNTYVKNCRGQLAPKHLFKSLNTSVTPSGFRAGMKLEAVDRKNPSLICVATISAAVDTRLLIHFDNWDDTYDYWCDASSPYIHPVGYCEEVGLTLTTPAEYKQPKSFSWEKYLEETGTQAAPARAFKQRPPHGFQTGTKLEAVDKRNAMLIRVTTISDTDDHRVKIHFDGWNDEYDYWLDADSAELHPVGWCQKTGHPLQHPNSPPDSPVPPGQGCPTPGCNGVGHIRGPRYGTHYTMVSCPYSDLNLNKDGLVPDRLSGEKPVTLSGPPRHRRAEMLTQTSIPTPIASTPEPPDTTTDVCPQSRAVATPKCVKAPQVKQEGDGKDSLPQFLHESVFCGWEPPKFQLCWEKHGKLLPEALGLTAKRVAKWNTEEVASFVRELPGCREHAATFRKEQIDGEAFLLLTQSDIVKILSIKLGPALKIYNCILMLKSADEE